MTKNKARKHRRRGVAGSGFSVSVAQAFPPVRSAQPRDPRTQTGMSVPPRRGRDITFFYPPAPGDLRTAHPAPLRYVCPLHPIAKRARTEPCSGKQAAGRHGRRHAANAQGCCGEPPGTAETHFPRLPRITITVRKLRAFLPNDLRLDPKLTRQILHTLAV